VNSSEDKLLGKLEEQGRWMGLKLDKIESKVDKVEQKLEHLTTSHLSLKAKLFTGCALISFGITIFLEWIKK
jgi:hypothetical protein